MWHEHTCAHVYTYTQTYTTQTHTQIHTCTNVSTQTCTYVDQYIASYQSSKLDSIVSIKNIATVAIATSHQETWLAGVDANYISGL